MSNEVFDAATMTPAERAALAQWAEREQRALEAETERRHARWAEEDAAKITDELDRERADERTEAATVARQAQALAVAAEARTRKSVVRSALPGLSEPERVAEEAAALAAHKRADEWRTIAKNAETRASVIAEPAIYGPTTRNSYFVDLALYYNPNAPGHAEARDRLERYGKALARDGGKAGMRARKVWRDATRKAADLESRSRDEYRAMSSGSASGGALVPPIYATEDYMIYRSAAPTVWEQLTTPRALPDYGLEVEVPGIASGADMGVQASENVAPSELDPTGAYKTITVATHYGEVTASQQLHDRVGPTGFDSVIFAQLRTQLDADVDSAVIAAMLTAPNTVTRTTSTALTLAQFLSDVGQSASKLQTTAGTRMSPSGLAAAGAISEWLMAQVTSNGDAWFKPSLGGMRQGGVTGQAISGIGLLVDDNIPAASSNAQLLVANKAATFVYAGEPIVDVLPAGGLAGSLSVTYRLRQYAAPLVRYPNGVTVVSGTGYPAAPTWA